jgi:lipopolysaccharide export system permease protein
MKLTIIDKYIARELLTTFVSVIFVLLIIVIGTELVHLLRWVAEGIIPAGLFFPYLINSLFEFSVILIPLSLLMGILLAFGRLYHDSEMAAIMSAGIGPMRWYRPLMLVAVPTTLILFVLLMFVQPIISHQRALIKAEVRSQVELDTLMVGQFNRANRGDGILFLESENKKNKQIENVFFQQHRENKSYVDLAASTSSYYDTDGQRYMMMHNGTHYIGNPGDANYKIIKYRDYGVFINKKQVKARLSEKTKNAFELWSSDKLEDQAELQWRMTIPAATIIVAVMALPLSRVKPRSGRYSRLAVALIIYLIYSNLLGVGKTWILQEKVPVWVGTWWVHLIAIIVTLLLLKYSGYLKTSRAGSTKIRAGTANGNAG